MEEHLLALDQYVEKFEKSLPSAIKDDDVFELERLINHIYLDQIEKACSSELEEAIIDALSWTSTMVNEIQRNPDGTRGQDYFKTIKHLANLLKRIRYYLK